MKNPKIEKKELLEELPKDLQKDLSIDDIIKEHRGKSKDSVGESGADIKTFDSDDDIIDEILKNQQRKKSSEALKKEAELESLKNYEMFNRTMDIAVQESKNSRTKQIRGLKKDKIAVSPPHAKVIVKKRENNTENKKSEEIPVDVPKDSIENKRKTNFDINNNINSEEKPEYDEGLLMQYKVYKDGRNEKVKDFFENDGQDLRFGTNHRAAAVQPDGPDGDEKKDTGEYDSEKYKENFENIKLGSDDGEFSSDAGAVKIFLYLKKLRKLNFIKTVILGFLFIISAGVMLGEMGGISLSEILSGGQTSNMPVRFLTSYLIVLVLAVLVSHRDILNGFKSFLTFKSEDFREIRSGSLPSFIAFFGLLQIIVLLLFNSGGQVVISNVYTPMVIFALLIQSIGKGFFARRAFINFKFVANPKFDRHSVNLIENEGIATELTKGALSETPVLAVNRKTKFLTDFLYHTNRPNITDTALRIISLIILIFAIAAGTIIWRDSNDITAAVGAALFILCFSAPVGYFLITAVPQLRLAKKLHRKYCAVLGYGVEDGFTEINSCGVDGNKLFPNGTLVLEGIRTFSGKRIDEAILDAASVLNQADSILCDIFMQVIMKREDILKPVDSILYEDTMGITAWVDDRRVLIGTRELMINHNIAVPSKKFESKHMENGQDLVYLSNSGELTAVFIVSLHPDEDVKEALEQMEESDIYLIVKSVDPIMTKQKLAAVFGVEPALFKILPSRLHEAYKEQAPEEKRLSAAVSNDGSFNSYISAVVGAVRLKASILTGFILILALVTAALGFSFYYVCAVDEATIPVFHVFLYQLISVLLVVLIPRIRKL